MSRRSDSTSTCATLPSDRSFRILSIDGGGICGILPASVLAELEHRFLGGQSVARHFDMIAGTCCDRGHHRPRSRAWAHREDDPGLLPAAGHRCFRLRHLKRWLRQKHRYVYERGPLEDELLRIFGDAVLGRAQTRLRIPAFEGRHGEPWFKTPHHPHYQKDRVANSEGDPASSI